MGINVKEQMIDAMPSIIKKSARTNVTVSKPASGLPISQVPTKIINKLNKYRGISEPIEVLNMANESRNIPQTINIIPKEIVAILPALTV